MISIVFDISEKVDKFIRKEVPFLTVMKYYVFYFLPFLLNLISPIFIFISALYFTSRMAYRSEIIALFSSGVSFWRLLRPYLLVAFLLTGVDFYLKGWVIPITNKGLVDFESKYLSSYSSNPNKNIHRQLAPGEYFSLDRYINRDTLGYKFAYEVFEGQELKKKIRATYLRWDNKRDSWFAHKYFIREFKGQRVQKIERGDSLFLELDINPEDFQEQEKSITAMITPELINAIEEETLRGNPDLKFYKVELYKRYSIPFASFILIMIAFAVSSHKVRGGTGMHLMLGLLIAVTFILFMRFTITFGQQSSLHPLAAVWIPNLFFMGIAFYLLVRAPK